MEDWIRLERQSSISYTISLDENLTNYMADLTAAVKAFEKVHDESDRETKLANAMI